MGNGMFSLVLYWPFIFLNLSVLIHTMAIIILVLHVNCEEYMK